MPPASLRCGAESKQMAQSEFVNTGACASTGQLEEPGAASADTPDGSHIDRGAGS